MAKKKKGLGRFFDKAKEAIGNVLNAPAQAAQFVATLPFRPMMISILKKRGISPKDKQSELVDQFFKNVIKKQSLEAGEEYLVEDIVSIVKAVVTFFKDKKDRLEAKQASGETLSEGEQNTLDHTRAIEKAASTAIKEEVTQRVQQKAGKIATSPIVLIGVAAAAYFLIKKK